MTTISPADPARQPLFESVPNLSTAHDAGLLEELEACMTEAGVEVVDRSADRDHRRSVWTWLGDPVAFERAAAACLRLLGARRRLDRHRGAHPRTGLFDVFPWIPLADLMGAAGNVAGREGSDRLRASTSLRHSTMDDARARALVVARRLAGDAELPVYLYEHAASSEDRRDLARHRRELLRTGDLSIPTHWTPDAGPARPHPRLGVLMVGVRRPLVAFNVDLETDDVRVARAIAATIRQKTPGGLPGVKALGLFLPGRGRAQVSVNLVDAERTDLPHLVARIRFEAEKRGHRIRRGERIGLLTEPAVAGASAEDLALEELRPEHLIETHVRRRLGLS